VTSGSSTLTFKGVLTYPRGCQITSPFGCIAYYSIDSATIGPCIKGSAGGTYSAWRTMGAAVYFR
jgi:hypothetical protein